MYSVYVLVTAYGRQTVVRLCDPLKNLGLQSYHSSL